jgi:hypothetical protein
MNGGNLSVASVQSWRIRAAGGGSSALPRPCRRMRVEGATRSVSDSEAEGDKQSRDEGNAAGSLCGEHARPLA